MTQAAQEIDGASEADEVRSDATKGPAHKILVVDDEEPILFAISEFLGLMGWDVDCARELEEAGALLAHVRYAAVIADLRLTGTYGVEGLQIISEVRERCADARVILLTAYGSPEIEAAARARGADAFLHKPIPLAQLAQIISDLLQAPK